MPSCSTNIRACSRRFLLVALLPAVMSFVTADDRKLTVYLIGDSTMSLKQEQAYPETGWGMPFRYFFDSSVTIDNRAQNGRSTRSFLAEQRWQPVVSRLQPGDYVLIQFGHNDESKDKGDRYTTPGDYKMNLKLFVRDARQKGAVPVLITPVSRRRFDAAGNALETHPEYAPLVREAAQETGTSLIDLDAESIALFQRLGDSRTKLLFNQLEAGEHPNYPDGVKDNTHFNELGARMIAQLVLKDIIDLNLDLKSRIVRRAPKKK